MYSNTLRGGCFRRFGQIRGAAGSTLVWVLVVTLVIAIVLGMALFAITARINSAVNRHEERQAYYTALSSLDTISQWISSADDATASAAHKAEVEDFLAAIPHATPGATPNATPSATPSATEDPAGISIELDGLPQELGTCTVSLCFTDERRDELLLVATATCDDTTEALSLTMLRGPGAEALGAIYPSSGFDPSAYDSRVAELNSRVVDTTPALLGIVRDRRKPSQQQDIETDEDDLRAVAPLTKGNTTDEAKVEWFWVDNDRNATHHFPAPDLLSFTSANAHRDNQEDIRTAVMPANGRMTVNPFRYDYFSNNVLPAHASSAEIAASKTTAGEQNARFVSLDISHTANNDVELRLGGDMRNGEKYASLLAFDFVDQYTGDSKTANEHVEYLPNNQMLSTMLAQGANGSIQGIAINYKSDLRQDYWYRQKWKSGTIYTQDTRDTTINGGLQGWLIFVPFYHGHVWTLSAAEASYIEQRYDYWNESSHVTNPNYGQQRGDFYRAFPENSSEAGRNRRGMSSYPVYWGEDFSLYLLDNVAPTDNLKRDAEYKANKAWLQQGVNILGRPDAPSTVYSTRGLTIGATQRRTAATKSAEGINTDDWLVGHYMEEDPDNSAEAYFAQLRWGTLLYETDIVLLTPGGTSTPRTSAIRRPLRYNDVYQSGDGSASERTFWRKFESYFLPKTQIVGGHIYVGAGQTLTIEGGTPLYRNPNGAEWSPTKAGLGLQATGEYTMHVAPDDITVAAGATLIIKTSESINITTSIYVDGGTLVIEPGAKIRGNIYCYNNGEVVLSGSFALHSPHDDGWDSVLTPEEELDGIHIYGKGLVGVVPGITAPGSLRVPSAAHAGSIKITGSSNKVHLLGPFAELITVTTGGKPSYNAVKGLLCDGHDEVDGSCQHVDATPGGWLMGGYGAASLPDL